MAKDINEVKLEGRVGRDAEERTFQNGGSIVTFSMVTERRYKDKTTDEWKGIPTWHNIVVSRDDALLEIARDIKKGDRIELTGSIATREYQDKDGNNRKSFDISVTYGGLLNVMDDGNKPSEKQAPKGKVSSDLEDLDDIPF
jgi:single-strand DNA-binding protein